MWLLIECDSMNDVGKNETQRYLLSDYLSVVTRPDGVSAVMALGKKVK